MHIRIPHIHTQIHIHRCIHTTHTHTHIHIHLHAYAHMDIYPHTHTHMYTDTTHTHTHTHTHPLPQEPWGLRSEAPLLRQTLGPLAPPVGLRFSLDPSGPGSPLPRLPSQTAHVQAERRGRCFLSPPRGQQGDAEWVCRLQGWGDPCRVNDTRG